MSRFAPPPRRTSPDPTLHLPRILCLHGGGSNAEIFQIQLRNLTPHLSPHFRLITASAPFLCAGPGPGILPFFEGMSPYLRWLRWKPGEHASVGDEAAVGELEASFGEAMERDSRLGATGEWVGLLGFSQGAKVAGSVLLEMQLQLQLEAQARGLEGGGGEKGGKGEGIQGFAGARWKFAICMNGSPPLVSLSERSVGSAILASADGLSELSIRDFEAQEVARTQKKKKQGKKEVNGASSEGTSVNGSGAGAGAFDAASTTTTRASQQQQKDEEEDEDEDDKYRLALPTLHVHGLEDERVEMHRWLVRAYTRDNSAEVVEWQGEHRLPLKGQDNRRVAAGILRVAGRAGVDVGVVGGDVVGGDVDGVVEQG